MEIGCRAVSLSEPCEPWQTRYCVRIVKLGIQRMPNRAVHAITSSIRSEFKGAKFRYSGLKHKRDGTFLLLKSSRVTLGMFDRFYTSLVPSKSRLSLLAAHLRGRLFGPPLKCIRRGKLTLNGSCFLGVFLAFINSPNGMDGIGG